MLTARLIGVMAFLLGSFSPAFSCSSAITPQGQSFRWFYDADAYGRLGVLGLSNNVHILDEYRCYDLSFLRNKDLRFYFNNKTDGADASPTYIGAIIVRLFTGSTYSEGPYSGYLYRNSTGASQTSSKWVHRQPNKPPVREGEVVPNAEMTVLSNTFSPKQAIRALSVDELNKQMRMATSQVVERLKEWHAMVATPTSNGFLVNDDSTFSDEAWGIEPKIEGRIADDHYFIARGYLVKYQDSSNPRSEYFFQSGAQQADCVYIKLVASADFVTKLAIRHRPNGPDFITLKMHRDAVCE